MLHGDVTTVSPTSPFHWYEYKDGRTGTGSINVAWQLLDVDEGDGGFVSAPAPSVLERRGCLTLLPSGDNSGLSSRKLPAARIGEHRHEPPRPGGRARRPAGHHPAHSPRRFNGLLYGRRDRARLRDVVARRGAAAALRAVQLPLQVDRARKRAPFAAAVKQG